MTFQIHALPAEDFAHLFDLSDEDLAKQRARRMTITESPGSPCRVSLADAEVGETVILANHTHLPADTPFHASHAVFVRKDKAQVHPAPGDVPAAFRSRVISLRAVAADGMIRDAVALPGTEIDAALTKLLSHDDTVEVHIHYAGPGCFAAKATRA